MSQIFGFGPRREEGSEAFDERKELEMRLGLIRASEDPFSLHVGNSVQLYLHGGNVERGQYQGTTTKGFAVLMNYVRPLFSYERVNKGEFVGAVIDEGALYVPVNAVVKMHSMPQEEINALVEQTNARGGKDIGLVGRLLSRCRLR